MSRLARFRAAQRSADSGFESALAEIRAGQKKSHWIWYVFPQLAGLGTSVASRTFAIQDELEAAEFLRDAELRGRLLSITCAVAEQLRSGRAASLTALFASEIDAQKVVSSLTLFGAVARTLGDNADSDDYTRLAEVCDEVLGRARLEGYPPCAFTLKNLRRDAK